MLKNVIKCYKIISVLNSFSVSLHVLNDNWGLLKKDDSS